jgi:hypothetical protein
MTRIVQLIEERKREFAALPFFQFIQDDSLDPLQRFAFVPCMAPFAASFRDFNIHTLRQEPTNDPIQKAINRHTYEDETHYKWYLEDLEKMGFNHELKFTDALKFLWGEETLKTRRVCYDLHALYTTYTHPLLRLVIIEAVEETGNVAFGAFIHPGAQLQGETQHLYRYYGRAHLAAENGHMQNNEHGLDYFLGEVDLELALENQACELIDQVFDIFTRFMNECHDFAQNNPAAQPFRTAVKRRAMAAA